MADLNDNFKMMTKKKSNMYDFCQNDELFYRNLQMLLIYSLFLDAKQSCSTFIMKSLANIVPRVSLPLLDSVDGLREELSMLLKRTKRDSGMEV